MRRFTVVVSVVFCTFAVFAVGFTPRASAQNESDTETSSSETTDSRATEQAAAEPSEGGAESETSDEEAESSETVETDTGSAEATATSEPIGVSQFGGGSFDVMASLGLGSLLYPILELGLDLGVVPLSDKVTLSLGGSGALGYCLLCGAVSALSGFQINAWNVSPQARIAAHYNLKEDLGAPLDAYMAFSTGPDFYFVNIRAENVQATGTVFAWAFVPILGARYFPSEPNNFFGFGEFRWLTEIGVAGGSYSNSEWDQNVTWSNSGYTRRGFDFILGGGLRF